MKYNVEVEGRPAVADRGGSASAAAGLARLGALLWNERVLLRQARSQPLGPDELHTAKARLSELELLRALETELLAETFGLLPTATLAQFIDAVPEPWPTILGDHRGALLALSDALSPLVWQRSLSEFLA
jgi:hypothetical protein